MKNWKILILSLLVTAFYSLKVLYLTMVKQKPRLSIDELTRSWSNKILKLARVNYRIFNACSIEFVPNKSYVVMSNHASHYDIPLIFVAFPRGSIRMIAKKELFRVPIWGHAMRAAEFVSIDRKNRRQAIKDLHLAYEKMQNGIIPWIAPEGTRTRTGEMQAFKKGGFVLASKTNAIIIPVGIRGSGKILAPDTWDFHLNQNVEIYIGEPIDSAKYQNIQELMVVVEQEIKNMLNSKP